MNVNESDGFVLPSTAQQLRKICEDNKITDPDLVLDVYIVCSNKGVRFIPDEELMKDIERTDPHYWRHRLEISKRKEFLERMASSNYMQALIQLNDPMKAVLTFADHLRKAYEAKEKALKGRSLIDHKSGGFEGTYMSEAELDQMIGHDAELDFDTMVDKMTTYQDMCESDEAAAFMSGCGMGCYFDANQVPGRSLAAAVVQHGASMPSRWPLLFEQFTKLSEKLGIAHMKTVDAEEEQKRKRSERMDDYSQVGSVDPFEIAQDTFEAKFAYKALDIKQDLKDEDGMSYLFVMLDVSGSMMCADLGGRVCRAFAANVVTLALLQFAMKGRYKVYVVPFTGDVNRRAMQVATDRDSALKAMRWLGQQEYDGGSTDIQRAVLWAYNEVQTDPEYKKCDVVVITDGCSPIDNRLTDEKPRDTKVRTLIFAEGAGYGSHSKALRSASDTYHVITWDNNKNEFTVGNALTGINSDHSSLTEE